MRKVLGMEIEEQKIINDCSVKCDNCSNEIATCAKLYECKGENETICVEMN